MSHPVNEKSLVTRTHRFEGTLIVLFACLAFYASFRYFAYPNGAMGPAYDRVIGVVIAIVGMTAAIFGIWFGTLRVDLGEHGVTAASLFGCNYIPFAELSQFACAGLQVRGGYHVDQVVLSFVDPDRKSIRLVTQGKRNIAGLEGAVKLISLLMADKLEQRLQSEGSVQIGSGLKLDGTRLHLGEHSFPLSGLRYEVSSGQVLFLEGADIVARVPYGGWNVVPFLRLFERLCDGKRHEEL